MHTFRHIKSVFFLGAVCIFNLISIQATAQNYPASDPNNDDSWILNNELSDEFNGIELNKSKWWILGENGDYRSKWKGRAPGQFAAHNVKVEGGELVLTSQWEPSFTFVHEKHEGTWYGGSTTAADKSKPITQACILSERFFKYGYMEIRCKAADAPVTNAFWTTGYHSEIDMTENYGKRPIGNPENKPETLERKYRTNMISWDPDKSTNYKPWKNEELLDVRVASDYYVYGVEWDENYIKVYFNGELLTTKSKSDLESTEAWRHDYAQELWIDSEVFSWYGLPSMQDLANNVGEYKIDYVRIWQKEVNGPYFDALGFEGPFYYGGRSSNWWANNAHNWRIKDEKVASGDLSLRYKQSASITGNHTMWSPYGSIDLPAGSNKLSFKVWIDESTQVDKIYFILNKPYLLFNIDISGVAKGEWVEVSHDFTRSTASNPSLTSGDRLGIQVRVGDVTGTNNLFYIDDITFENVNSTAKVPVVSFTADVTKGEKPLKVQFTDESENIPTTWSWDFDNDGIEDSAERNPSYTYAENGTYAVMLTATNAEGSNSKTIESYIVVEDVTGVNTIDASLVDIYPNPASSVVSVACIYADEIKIYNTAGVLIKDEIKISDPQQLSIGSLNKGVYVLTLLSENAVIFTQKLVVL